MLTTFAFDVCLDVYKSISTSIASIPVVSAEHMGDGLWRPHTRPRMLDYTADFAIAGRSALDRPGRRKLLPLFDLFYMGGGDYIPCRRVLGISEITWSDWCGEISRHVGEELLRRKIFPPARYFNGELDKEGRIEASRRVSSQGRAGRKVNERLRATERELAGEDWQASALGRNTHEDAQEVAA